MRHLAQAGASATLAPPQPRGPGSGSAAMEDYTKAFDTYLHFRTSGFDGLKRTLGHGTLHASPVDGSNIKFIRKCQDSESQRSECAQ
eukprot:6402838-Alexandrium_andersonii.AAC.1